MPATIPDITLDDNDYTDIYTETTFPVGSAISIQNKSNKIQIVQEQILVPDSDNKDGFYLAAGKSVFITEDSPGVWVRGEGRVSVQLKV